jgi:hypothetical protein
MGVVFNEKFSRQLRTCHGPKGLAQEEYYVCDHYLSVGLCCASLDDVAGFGKRKPLHIQLELHDTPCGIAVISHHSFRDDMYMVGQFKWGEMRLEPPYELPLEIVTRMTRLPLGTSIHLQRFLQHNEDEFMPRVFKDSVRLKNLPTKLYVKVIEL